MDEMIQSILIHKGDFHRCPGFYLFLLMSFLLIEQISLTP